MDQRLQTIIARILEASDPAPRIAGALENRQVRNRATIAVGKAAGRMFAGLTEPGEAVVLIPEGAPGPPPPQPVLYGDHPVPTARNVQATEHVATFVRNQRRHTEEFLVLLSGGTSSLLTLPADGLELADIQELTRALLASGAEIGQINCIRKHCEQLKGGRLAALMAPAHVDALILSDVSGDDPGAIGSGPVSPDPTTFTEARGLVERFAPQCRRVLEFLQRGERGEVPETPKPGDAVFVNVRVQIIGNNDIAIEGARSAAEALGLQVIHVERGLRGDAAAVGRRLARMLLEAKQRGQRRCCIIMGGETTVALGDATGRGGRNQEVALAAALELDRAEGIAVMTLATDGVDGPTDAAGAIADGQTCRIAQDRGIDPCASLQNHDSHTLFGITGGLIRTGPTGTNVNDVAIGVIF